MPERDRRTRDDAAGVGTAMDLPIAHRLNRRAIGSTLPAKNATDAAHAIWKSYYTCVLFLALAALYILAPGHPALPFAGIPIGQSGVAALVALALVGGVIRRRRVPRAMSAWLCVLIVLKLAIASVAAEPGWLAHYYANATFAGAAERSIDYRSLDATRVDRTLAFADTSFPVHFFNDQRFDRGFRREYTDPFSVRWIGHLHQEAEQTVALVMHVRGLAVFRLDGREIARLEALTSPAETPVALPLSAGAHVLEVDYSKPAEMEGLFTLRGATTADGDALARVLPQPDVARVRVSNVLRVIALFVHLAALGLVIRVCAAPIALWLTEVRDQMRVDRASALLRLLEPGVVIGLTLQGLWKTRHLVGHVWTLTGGDDWMTFEHNARDVVLNGILMTQGAPLGRGSAYWAYPGYTYFTALVHAVTGESLAGVVLMNFVMLALATVFVLRLARLLVPAPAALLAVLWLLFLEQADFVRYYAMTLLSENLFFATSAGAVLGVTRCVIDPRIRWAVTAGAFGGASALTRPSIMLFLPCALIVIVVAGSRRGHPGRALTAAACAAAMWMAVISPATLRNYLVSSEPVLISAGQAKSFIDYNLPPQNQQFYLDMYEGSLTSVAIVLARVAIDQPAAYFRTLGYKIGFALGMVHWVPNISPHPELIITTVLYVLAFLVVPAARSLAALPIHLFVLTHLAVVTLSLPWNYGYRMILPMYPLMTVFAMAAAWRALQFARVKYARAT